MVSGPATYSNGMSLKRMFLATIINDIWGETLLFTAIATAVTAITKLTPHNLELDNDLLSVLGLVLGLVISFRTSSAYERYSDGRALWTKIATLSRTLAMTIWIGVSNERSDTTSSSDRVPTPLECIIEKKSMINLASDIAFTISFLTLIQRRVQALPVAIKHYLRGEPGVYYEDLYPLICFLPRYASGVKSDADMLALWHASEDGDFPIQHEPCLDSPSPSRKDTKNTSTSTSTSTSRSLFGFTRKHKVFDPEKVLPIVEVHRPLKPARNPPPVGFTDYFPFLKIFKFIAKPFRRSPGSQDVNFREALGGKKPKPKPCDSNVPVELSLFLLNYVSIMVKSNNITGHLAEHLVDGLHNMQDIIANLERVADTPLPFAYQAHLRISMWIYLLALPFQLVGSFGWVTIPGVAFSTFLYLGFLEIGQQIENPFNYDLNDLDLDEFCYMIQRELHEIVAHPTPHPSEYIFSTLNQPFAPADRRNAQEILNVTDNEYTHTSHGPDSQPGKHSLQRTFLQAWKDVDLSTRRP